VWKKEKRKKKGEGGSGEWKVGKVEPGGGFGSCTTRTCGDMGHPGGKGLKSSTKNA